MATDADGVKKLKTMTKAAMIETGIFMADFSAFFMWL
jgi:hypothetical protein